MSQERRTVIESERLYLRKVTVEDAAKPAYREWLNDPEVNRFMETRHRPWSFEDIEEYVRGMQKDPNQYFFAICLREKSAYEDDHIGNIKLGPVDWIHRRGDVSLFIGRKDLWGQGYASEAIDLLARFAFQDLNLHKLCAGIYFKNVASQKAFRKAHFREEGFFREHVFSEGEYQALVRLRRISRDV